MRKVLVKIVLLASFCLIIFSCKDRFVEQKEISYKILNLVIKDQQSKIHETLLVGNRDTVKINFFKLSSTPYGKFKFSIHKGKSKLWFKNTYRSLNKSSFPTEKLKGIYNYTEDSVLISKWDSTKVINCNQVNLNENIDLEGGLDIFLKALNYRIHSDVLLVSHPLFNREKDTAMVASILVTQKYVIQSYTDFAISDKIAIPFCKTRFLNKIETRTNIYDSEKRDEITTLIYRGSWKE